MTMTPNALFAEQAIILPYDPATAALFVKPSDFHKVTLCVEVASTDSADLAGIGFIQSTAATGGETDKEITPLSADVIVEDQFYTVEIDPSTMDVTNGFVYAGPTYGDNGTNVTSGVVILWPAKFARLPVGADYTYTAVPPGPG